jgi:energy-coupling factor transport system permease protein
MEKKKGGWNFKYTTRDIVVIAILVAIGGAIAAPLGNLWYVANSSLGPLGGALLQGVFMWTYVLGMWLVRKPGTALIIGILTVLVELALGNVSGIGTLGWGVTQGLAIEVIMAFGKYRNFSMLAAILCGAGASQFGTAWTAILYGWDPATVSDVWFAVPVNLISGAIASGLVPYLLTQAIARTGLVRTAQAN